MVILAFFPIVAFLGVWARLEPHSITFFLVGAGPHEQLLKVCFLAIN